MAILELGELKDLINSLWIERYGGRPVESLKELKTRIIMIAMDRDCWVFNAKATDKERLKPMANFICVWKQDEDESSNDWHTQCGNRFTIPYPSYANIYYCPFCGKEIEENLVLEFKGSDNDTTS